MIGIGGVSTKFNSRSLRGEDKEKVLKGWGVRLWFRDLVKAESKCLKAGIWRVRDWREQ